LFCLLAKNFGLNTNGETSKIATSIPFSIIRKEGFEVENLEALLFRQGLLDVEKEDNYFKDLKFSITICCTQIPNRKAVLIQFSF
jgi:hypothetical protein